MAKCPKCFADLPEGARWCSFCGEKIEEAPSMQSTSSVPAAEPVPEQAPAASDIASDAEETVPVSQDSAAVNAPVPDGAAPDSAAAETQNTYIPPAPEQGLAVPPAGYYDAAAPAPVPPPAARRPRKKILILGGAGLVGLVAIIAAIAIGIMQIPVYPAVVYAKDSTISFALDDSWKPMELTRDAEITEQYTTYMGSLSVQYGSNGRKMFYLDGDDSTELFVRDLKKDNTKSDAAQRLDTNLKQYFYVLQDGKYAAYIRDTDDKLCLHNMDERITVAKDVEGFIPSRDGKRLLYINEEKSLYMTEVSDKPEPEKIDGEISDVTAFSPDLKTVYYIKDGSLYVKRKGEDKQKVSSADSVEQAYYVGGSSVYFVNESAGDGKAWDYVVDDLADQDAAAVKPKQPDYGEKPVMPKRSDFYDEDYHFNTEAYNAAREEYDRQLQAYQDNRDKLDEAYTAAEKLYQAKLDRDELRAALKEEDVNIHFYELFYYDGKEAVSVAKNVTALPALTDAGYVVCSRREGQEPGSLKLSEITTLNDVEEMLEQQQEEAHEIYSVAAADKLYDLDADEVKTVNFSKDGKTLYYLDGKNLWKTKVTSSGLEKTETVDEDVDAFWLTGGAKNLIYTKDTTESGSADLYQDGTKIAADVYNAGIFETPDSATLYCITDYSAKNGKGTLTQVSDGKAKAVGQDVRPRDVVVYRENQVAFITDYNTEKGRGTLMLYTGGKKNILVDEDVKALIPRSLSNFWEMM